ncbi:AT-rich interactive domain-containing protein 3B isoform X1 [Microcaecilia unicolor]|uniref:AT-rich interactive domain-containing protein 3 n=1 Tax=Microcaecilia unicolor TaxID=1415580 RepID=A0A6P7WYM9_9AMPH|nr:AT-rich interactive domain-containing protein 3B isoform X1 [Microcaecilia unicolor]
MGDRAPEKESCGIVGGQSQPSLISEGFKPVLSGSAHFHQHAKQGMKLEAVMEQLQKQQQQVARGMENRERQIREAQRLYTQQLATQQAVLAATSKGGCGPVLSSGATTGPSAGVVPTYAGRSVTPEPSEDEDEEGSLLVDETEQDYLDDDEVEEEEEEEDITEKDSALSLRYFQSPNTIQHDQGTASTSRHLPMLGIQAQRQQGLKEENQDRTTDFSAGSPSRHPNRSFDEQLKQNINLPWNEDADGGRGREASRDFAKLYELDSDPKRKEFLDDLFIFMQKKGTPISRIPIMAKQLLDLYMLYKLVTEKGGLVEVINKKMWREVTKGLNLPTSITSAAFTLRTQYMKYLYHYECEKKSLSSPAELQAAIDGNRREGRRPSYSSALFSYSSNTAVRPPSLLSPPKHHLPLIAVHPGGTSTSRLSQGITPKKGDGASVMVSVPSRMSMPVALASQQAAVAARMATLEQLRERLESGEPPEKRASRVSEEEQRLLQQAFQHNLLSMARQIPMKLRINGKADDRSEAAVSASLGNIGSINMSIEINGTMYTGVLFAQKPVVQLIGASGSQSSSSSSSSSVSGSHCSQSSTSSKGAVNAEPSTSWSL